MQAQFQLRILPVDKDSAFIAGLKLQTSFRNNFLADEYIQSLPALLQSKGYIAASVDSIHADSTFSVISLYIGDAYKWAYLNTTHVNKTWLNAIGWNDRLYANRPFNWVQYAQLRQNC